jgi:hypothetical protein
MAPWWWTCRAICVGCLTHEPIAPRPQRGFIELPAKIGQRSQAEGRGPPAYILGVESGVLFRIGEHGLADRTFGVRNREKPPVHGAYRYLSSDQDFGASAIANRIARRTQGDDPNTLEVYRGVRCH